MILIMNNCEKVRSANLDSSQSVVKYRDRAGGIAQSVTRLTSHVTHRWAAHHCVGGSNPNACERSLASHAVYMLIQCTPLLVEKAGVAPVVTFRIIARKQESMQARYPLWIWNPWGRTHEVQNRSNQWLHKMDLGPRNFFKNTEIRTNEQFSIKISKHPLVLWILKVFVWFFYILFIHTMIDQFIHT